MRLAVVGGGLSGLTVAFYLKRLMPSAELTLIEASARVGGVIETEHRDGWLIEHGADCFSVHPPDALRLCQDLGVADQLVQPLERGRRAMISKGDRLFPVPEGFVLMRPTRLGQILKSPLLSWAGKLRIARERFIAPRREETDESLADFARRRLGQEAFERLVQPLVAGIYTADAERLSMQATMSQFVKMERQYGSLMAASKAQQSKRGDAAEQEALERGSSGARYGQFRVFPEGMGRLFELIQSSLPTDCIQFGKSVQGLSQAGNQWQLALSNGESTTADGVVLALPSHLQAKLLEPVNDQLAKQLQQIEYASSAIVLLAVSDADVERMPEAFGFVVPEIERRPILAASFASHKFSKRSPQGQTLIRVFIGGAIRPELLSKSDEELTNIAIDEMRKLIGFGGRPDWTAVQRWNDAMPQYHVGHVQLAESIEREMTHLKGLELAGNGLHGVGVSFVVGAARRAAERLCQSLEAVNV